LTLRSPLRASGECDSRFERSGTLCLRFGVGLQCALQCGGVGVNATELRMISVESLHDVCTIGEVTEVPVTRWLRVTSQHLDVDVDGAGTRHLFPL